MCSLQDPVAEGHNEGSSNNNTSNSRFTGKKWRHKKKTQNKSKQLMITQSLELKRGIKDLDKFAFCDSNECSNFKQDHYFGMKDMIEVCYYRAIE